MLSRVVFQLPRLGKPLAFDYCEVDRRRSRFLSKASMSTGDSRYDIDDLASGLNPQLIE